MVLKSIPSQPLLSSNTTFCEHFAFLLFIIINVIMHSLRDGEMIRDLGSFRDVVVMSFPHRLIHYFICYHINSCGTIFKWKISIWCEIKTIQINHARIIIVFICQFQLDICLCVQALIARSKLSGKKKSNKF